MKYEILLQKLKEDAWDMQFKDREKTLIKSCSEITEKELAIQQEAQVKQLLAEDVDHLILLLDEEILRYKNKMLLPTKGFEDATRALGERMIRYNENIKEKLSNCLTMLCLNRLRTLENNDK